MIWLLVGVGGGLGALARFELGTWVAEHTGSQLPVGTLAVNTIGSFLAGLVWSMELSGTPGIVISSGFLGGFTTFSTWTVETVRLFEDDPRPGRGLANLGAMIIAGLAGVTLGASLL